MAADRLECRAILYGETADDPGEIYVHAGDMASHLEAFARKAQLAGLDDEAVTALKAAANMVLDYGAMALRNRPD